MRRPYKRHETHLPHKGKKQKLIISPRRRRHRPAPRRQEPFLSSRRRPNPTLNPNLNPKPYTRPFPPETKKRQQCFWPHDISSNIFFVVEISEETKTSPAPSSQSRAERAPRAAGASPLWIAWRRPRRKAQRGERGEKRKRTTKVWWQCSPSWLFSFLFRKLLFFCAFPLPSSSFSGTRARSILSSNHTFVTKPFGRKEEKARLIKWISSFQTSTTSTARPPSLLPPPPSSSSSTRTPRSTTTSLNAGIAAAAPLPIPQTLFSPRFPLRSMRRSARKDGAGAGLSFPPLPPPSLPPPLPPPPRSQTAPGNSSIPLRARLSSASDPPCLSATLLSARDSLQTQLLPTRSQSRLTHRRSAEPPERSSFLRESGGRRRASAIEVAVVVVGCGWGWGLRWRCSSSPPSLDALVP